jgi:hypothetical protein
MLSTTSEPDAGHAGTGDQPALGWTVVLRRQPPRSAAGWPPHAFELICCYCGDHPDLDYLDVSPELQRIRGPYPLPAGVAAYERHLGQCHRQPVPLRPGRPGAGPGG